MELLITIGCLLFAWRSGRMLLEVPIAQWALEQYLLLLVTFALAAFGVLYAVRYFRKEKARAAERKAQDEKRRRQAEEKRQKEQEFEDLSYLDEDLVLPAGEEIPLAAPPDRNAAEPITASDGKESASAKNE